MGSQSRLVDGTYSVVSTYLLQITNYKLYKITNMNINKLFLWSLITIVSTTVDGRVFGKPWGWATASGLKPNSLNTIVLNDCVGRPSVFFHHKHSNTKGEQIAKMVGDVATSVTSRAIMDIITHANGHSPVSCSQSELVEMESQYESCIKRVQYKLKCFHLSKDRQCEMITEFLEDCTKGMLGLCSLQLFDLRPFNKWTFARLTPLYLPACSGWNQFESFQSPVLLCCLYLVVCE